MLFAQIILIMTDRLQFKRGKVKSLIYCNNKRVTTLDLA